MAAKVESTDRQSASAATGSDDKLSQQILSIVGDLQRAGLQPNGEPVEGDDLRLGIAPDLDHDTSERKKLGSRRFGRYLVAILIGVAATLAWQSYGESAKQIIAKRAPELGWSPETKQMISTSIQWIGWTKPSAGPEKQSVPVPQTAPAAPSVDVQQMTQSLAGLRQTVEQLAGSQDQMARELRRVESAVAELNAKIPESPYPSVAPAPKPMSAPPSSRAR